MGIVGILLFHRIKPTAEPQINNNPFSNKLTYIYCRVPTASLACDCISTKWIGIGCRGHSITEIAVWPIHTSGVLGTYRILAFIFLDITMPSGFAQWACARIRVDAVDADAIVLAGVWRAIFDNCTADGDGRVTRADMGETAGTISTNMTELNRTCCRRTWRCKRTILYAVCVNIQSDLVNLFFLVQRCHSCLGEK